VEAGAMFCLRSEEAKTARRGREHLVELERSEQLYLVTCDTQMAESGSRNFSKKNICDQVLLKPVLIM